MIIRLLLLIISPLTNKHEWKLDCNDYFIRWLVKTNNNYLWIVKFILMLFRTFLTHLTKYKNKWNFRTKMYIKISTWKWYVMFSLLFFLCLQHLLIFFTLQAILVRPMQLVLHDHVTQDSYPGLVLTDSCRYLQDLPLFDCNIIEKQYRCLILNSIK